VLDDNAIAPRLGAPLDALMVAPDNTRNPIR